MALKVERNLISCSYDTGDWIGCVSSSGFMCQFSYGSMHIFKKQCDKSETQQKKGQHTQLRFEFIWDIFFSK